MITIDCTIEAGDWPPQDRLTALAGKALNAAAEMFDREINGEVSLLFTDNAHIRILNRQWRGKDKPTNVLSFPASAPPPGVTGPPSLGDIVVARETVMSEASEEGKSPDHHLTHLLVHGFFHLLGYDHETDEDAEEMEELERQTLKALAIRDPYA